MNAQSKTSNTINDMTQFNKRFFDYIKSNIKVYIYKTEYACRFFRHSLSFERIDTIHNDRIENNGQKKN